MGYKSHTIHCMFYSHHHLCFLAAFKNISQALHYWCSKCRWCIVVMPYSNMVIWWCSWMNPPINGKTYVWLNIDISIPCYQIQLEKLNFMLMKFRLLSTSNVVHNFPQFWRQYAKLSMLYVSVDTPDVEPFIGVSGGLNCRWQRDLEYTELLVGYMELVHPVSSGIYWVG